MSRIKHPVSQEQALAIAKGICLEQEWPWEGILVYDTNTTYEVMTEANFIGSNAHISVNKNNGEVISASRSMK